MVHTLTSSFQFPFMIYHCRLIKCNLSRNKERGNKSKLGQAQIKKVYNDTFLLQAAQVGVHF